MRDSVVYQSSAEERYEAAKSCDPLPQIAPALLNSGDIWRYVEKTGMIDPVFPDNMKSASYSISIGRRIISWDENRKLCTQHLGEGDVFELPENSIVFVETLEKFRLPDYIAMRFNLKIDAVHKGLLLGTGPLVDPGYEGTLLIPLHNLTTNKYYFYFGERFVWVEFTKISPHPRWCNDLSNDEARAAGTYVAFPKKKANLEPHEYLSNAHKGEIRSSIPDATREARADARRAQYLSAATLVGVVAVIVSVFGVGAVILNVVRDNYNSRFDDISERIDNLEKSVKSTSLREPRNQTGSAQDEEP